jgi:hypothetical protein
MRERFIYKLRWMDLASKVHFQVLIPSHAIVALLRDNSTQLTVKGIIIS